MIMVNDAIEECNGFIPTLSVGIHRTMWVRLAVLFRLQPLIGLETEYRDWHAELIHDYSPVEARSAATCRNRRSGDVLAIGKPEDAAMTKVVIDVTMSLDGFIAGPGDGCKMPLGGAGAVRREAAVPFPVT